MLPFFPGLESVVEPNAEREEQRQDDERQSIGDNDDSGSAFWRAGVSLCRTLGGEYCKTVARDQSLI